MSNPLNNGNLTGNLANDPKIFPNSDGSHKVVFSVYAERNFKNKTTGQRDSDAIPVEAFVRAGTDIASTPFGNIHKGDKVALQTSLRMDTFTRKGSNETVYELKVNIESLAFLDSKTTSQNRLAQRVAAAEQTNVAVQAAPAVQAPVQAQAPVAQPAAADLPFAQQA